MQLTEKYRPASLAQVIGQAATVDSLRLMLSRGLSSKAFYFLGESGTGKDSLASALVGEMQIDALSVSAIAGADCTAEYVRNLADDFHNSSLFSTGDGWKACIVSEAHSMSRQAVQLWLPFLEKLPDNRLVIFTSNAGLEAYAEFSGALFSRCTVFSLEADLEAFAVHAASIAEKENLNGRPLEEYRSLLASCKGNLRAAIQQIEAGRMLKPFESIPVASKPVKACPQSTPRREICPKAVETVQTQTPASDEGKVIAAELEFGKRFLPGTKNPKYAAHLKRLAELRGQHA